MRARDVAGDRKSEAGAALVLVAGAIQPQERLEYFLAHVGGNARSVVIDRYGQIAVIAVAGDRDGVGVPRGIGNKVAEAALERRRLDGDHRQPMERHGRRMAVALGVAAHLLQRHCHVGRLRLFAAVAARKREIVLQHPRHLVDILAHAVDFGTVADQLQLQLETGEDGAQIVRHAGQHRGALLDRTLDARFHL